MSVLSIKVPIRKSLETYLISLVCITNNSIKHQSFVYEQLHGKRVLFVIIWFNTSHLFTPSLNGKQFYLTHRQNPIRCYHFRPEWTKVNLNKIDWIHSLVWLGFMAYCKLFKAKSYLCICIKYIWFVSKFSR